MKEVMKKVPASIWGNLVGLTFMAYPIYVNAPLGVFLFYLCFVILFLFYVIYFILR